MSAQSDQAFIQDLLNTGQQLPPGRFRGNWELTDKKGITVQGSGREATILIGADSTKPTLSFKGLWYSCVKGLSVMTERGTTAVLEVDKATFGVQGNRFEDLLVHGVGLNDGKMSDFCMTMNRISTNSGQGSEQMFINCHFSGASQACYYQAGYNALNNIFLGGNFQHYMKNAIELVAGSCHVLNVGFQSVTHEKQIDNDGWDIACYQAGVEDSVLVMGCRTESLRFIKSAWSQPATIIGCSQRWGIPTNYAIEYKEGTGVQHKGKIYKAIKTTSSTPGESTDWKLLTHNAVELDNGRVMDCRFQGTISQKKTPDINYYELMPNQKEIPVDAKLIAVNATKNLELNLPNPYEAPIGRTLVVKRVDNTPYIVILKSPYINDSYHYVPLLPRKSLTFYVMGGGNFTRRWYVDEPYTNFNVFSDTTPIPEDSQ